ncbi:hypothetical protein HYV73_01025 [Candidatus Uhrbacteria bacterium]|nr:hypothetical protein [Candidatus Uhrbacteria bacterium]
MYEVSILEEEKSMADRLREKEQERVLWDAQYRLGARPTKRKEPTSDGGSV